MDHNRFETELSHHTHSAITVREKNLTTDVMGQLSFPAALYYLWTGEEASESEEKIVDAMLTSVMVHGMTPGAIAARMTTHTEPEAMQAAVASGILGVGSRYLGTMKECADELQRIEATTYRDREIKQLVQDYRNSGKSFPGLGQTRLKPVDPRAERLFELAYVEGVAGENVRILEAIQAGFEAAAETTIPINITGALAAVGLDIGLSPTALRGIGVISRAAGITGEILEEEQRPMGGDIWEFIDKRTVRPDRYARKDEGPEGTRGGQ